MRQRSDPPSDATRLGPGERARLQLLDAAGEVFAERGYAEATSKEICERAGLNTASVNYYFGGFDPLYAEALTYAHHQLFSIEEARDIAGRAISPTEKLRGYLTLVLRRLSVPSTSWVVRLISREIVSPTPVTQTFITEVILPKLEVLRGILAELLDVEADHPIVGKSILMVVAPSLITAVAHRNILAMLVPEVLQTSADIQPLIDYFQRFIIAGLEAICEDLHPAKV